MFQVRAFVRNAFVSIPCAVLMIVLFVAGPARATDCQTALAGTSGFTVMVNGDTSNVTRGVEEWEGEVVKFTTSLPGVITMSGSGAKSQGSLFTGASSSPYPRIDTGKIGTGTRNIQSVLPAGYHCVEVTPTIGASGDVTVSLTFTDVCHLGDLDDHGDSFLCSTLITVGGGSVSGAITYANSTLDGDMFSFDLSSTTTVTIESSGSTDVNATLYDANGDILDTDDDSGSGSNFQIVAASLPAGRYFVRVEGAGTTTGSYSLSVTQ